MSSEETRSPYPPVLGHELTVLDGRGDMTTAWACVCGATFVDPRDAARHPADR